MSDALKARLVALGYTGSVQDMERAFLLDSRFARVPDSLGDLKREVYGEGKMTSPNGGAVNDVDLNFWGQPTFYLPFDDAGNGRVNTKAMFGGVTPTFTRATIATTVDSQRRIVQVASGVPRSYYHPTTGAYQGFFAEGGRTNLCLQSQAWNTTWASGGVNGTSVTANSTVAPDGTTTGDTVTSLGVGGSNNRGQVITSTAATYAFSCWLLAGSADSWAIGVFDTSAVDFLAATGRILYGPGAVSGATLLSFTGLSATEWTRVELVVTFPAGAVDDAIFMYPGGTGAHTNSAICWGAQFELGAFASSYIPTTTAAVTRNADELSFPTTGWANLGTNDGTFLCEFTPQGLDTAVTRKNLLRWTNAVSFERLEVRIPDDGSAVSAVAYGTGAAVLSLAPGALASGTAYKLALAYGSAGVAAILSGGSIVSNASASNFGTQSALHVAPDAGGTGHAFTTVRRVAYWPTRLTNAQLQRLTGAA